MQNLENSQINIIKNVIRNRLSQIIINEKYKNKEFKIPIHLAMGHESIATAVDEIMSENDQLVLTHRNIHYNLARSKVLKPELDEYYMKETGLASGELGSMNLANPNKNVVYTSSILGNNLPVATGLSLANKINNNNALVIVTTGDGAIEEGSFYESLLFLKTYKLNCIVLIENNEWSLATLINERRCHIDVSKISESLDIKYEEVSNNNVFDYINKLEQLKEYSFKENSPACLMVNLTTLGSWIMTNDENPNGKFINYHAGPAPSVHIKEIILDNSPKDPLYVLKNEIGIDLFEKLSKEVFLEVEEEVRSELHTGH